MENGCDPGPMSRRSWLSLLLLGSLWGASYMFIKIALEDLFPAMIVFGRTALAALVLVPFAARRGALAGLGESLWIIVVLALVQVAAPFLLISAGEQSISSSLTGILVSATPLFTAVLAIWVDHAERSTGPRALGLAAGFVGVALLIGVDLGGNSSALLGGLAVTLAALGYAIGGFIVKRRSARLAPLGIAAVTMVATAVLVAPLALVSAPAAAPSLGSIGAMLVLGVLGTGLAFAIFYSLTATVGPARVSLVTYIAPVFAVLYGVLLLGEQVGPGTFAGLALILGGSWLAAGQSLPSAWARRKAGRDVLAPPGAGARGSDPSLAERPAA
jgi:drug/metabolite transporter (DMT)-like permease